MGWRDLPDKVIVTISVPDGSNLDALAGGLVGAINRLADALAKPGDSLAAALRESDGGGQQFPDVEFIKQRLELIHDSTFQLNRKVEELMSTQESRLQGIQTALSSIADGINKLQEQIATLKVNNPDMEDEISGIETTVQGIADDISGVAPGGGGTGGGGGTEPTR